MRLHHESRGKSCKLMQASFCWRKISAPWYHRAFSIGVIFATLCVHKLLLPLTDIATFQKEDEKWNPTFEIWNLRYFCSAFRYVQKLSQMYRSRESRNKTKSKRATSKAIWWDAKIPTKLKYIAKKTTWMFFGRQPWRIPFHSQTITDVEADSFWTLRNTQRR